MKYNKREHELQGHPVEELCKPLAIRFLEPPWKLYLTPSSCFREQNVSYPGCHPAQKWA
jgi:hypothetical protein